MEENKPINNKEEVKPPYNEQQLNTSSTDEPIVPAGETSEIVNPPSEIKDMEVHHHTHTAHGKKNWKSYFWEFLMLFLAVFCGFLAEYQLEHKIESERGKQYTHSFYEDLLTDSSHFNKLISIYQKKLTVLQNLSPCYDSLLSDHPSKNCLLIIFQNSINFPDLINTDRTLMQLKNAGGLRLLKKEDADSIINYDNLLRKSKTEETTGTQELQYEISKTVVLLRNYEKWKDTSITPRVFALYNNNKELLNKYFNELDIYSSFCMARKNSLQNLKERNADLIEYFKAKYYYE